MKEFAAKGRDVPDSLFTSFDKQKQILNILKTIFDKIALHNNLAIRLKTARETNSPEVTLLQWKLTKLAKVKNLFYKKIIVILLILYFTK